MAKVDLLSMVKGEGRIKEFVRFVMVGGAATVTDLAVSIVLLYVFYLHENIVTTLAFLCAFLVSYFGHRNFTFKKSGSVLKFLLVSVSMLITRNVLVFLFMTLLDWHALKPLIVSMALVMIITFLLSKYLVFKGE